MSDGPKTNESAGSIADEPSNALAARVRPTAFPPVARRKYWILIALFVALTALYLPSLRKHFKKSLDPASYVDDSRQYLAPMLRFSDPNVSTDDDLSRYYLDLMPLLYKQLYRLAAALGAPLRTFAKLLLYPLLAILLWMAASSSKHLAGWPAALLTVVLILSTTLFLRRMHGGIPRSFAFPLIAAFSFALAAAKPRLLAFLTVAAGGIYNVVAVLGGAGLALLLVLPSRFTGLPPSGWPLKKRAILLGVTAAATLLMSIPPLARSQRYGPTLGPSAIREYPEAGISGRFPEDSFDPANRLSPPEMAAEAARAFGAPANHFASAVQTFARTNHTAVMSAVLALTLIGTILLCLRAAAARRLLILPAASIGLYWLSWFLAPYLFIPERYVAFTLPVLAVILFPAALFEICRRIPGPALGRTAATVAAWIFCFCLFGARIDPAMGLSRIGTTTRALHQTIEKLPHDVLIAGWPKGPVNSIPYFTGRRVLLNKEAHVIYHKSYTEEMRNRMRALVSAYFARDPSAIKTLRERWKVTHLLVDWRHYEDCPTYFDPFDAEIASARAALNGARPATRQIADACSIFTSDELALLDLARLEP